MITNPIYKLSSLSTDELIDILRRVQEEREEILIVGINFTFCVSPYYSSHVSSSVDEDHVLLMIREYGESCFTYTGKYPIDDFLYRLMEIDRDRVVTLWF